MTYPSGSSLQTGSKLLAGPLAGLLACAVLVVLGGCDAGEPRCACAPKSVEMLDVPVGGKRGAPFTVTNSGDGGTLSWFIEPVYQATLGLRLLESSAVYVLGEGETAQFNLLFQPTKEIADTTVSLRVGLDDCVIEVRLSAADLPPECTVTAPLLEISTAVGDTTERVVYVINTGGGQVSGTIFPIGCDAPFAVSFPSASYTLAPGDSALVRVEHIPLEPTPAGEPAECTVTLGVGCGSITVRGEATGTLGGGK